MKGDHGELTSDRVNIGRLLFESRNPRKVPKHFSLIGMMVPPRLFCCVYFGGSFKKSTAGFLNACPDLFPSSEFHLLPEEIVSQCRTPPYPITNPVLLFSVFSFYSNRFICIYLFFKSFECLIYFICEKLSWACYVKFS